MLTIKDKRSFFIPIAIVVIVALVLANMMTPRESTTYAAQSSKTNQLKYRWHRSSLIRSGKNEEALQFAIEVSRYVSNKHPEITVYPYLEIFGTVGKVHWFVDHKSLAEVERIDSELSTDEEYIALLKKATNLFVEGAGRDTMMMAIH